MILRYIAISLDHSVAISKIADRIEFEARLGNTAGILHLKGVAGNGSMGCIHAGPHIAFTSGRRAGKTWLLNLTWYPTPFGMCNSRDVAAELVLRQILNKEKLATARERGHDLPFLHLWER